MKLYFKLLGVDDSRPVNKETDAGFLFLYQRSLLLGLKESGHLTRMQHRKAEDTLLHQYRELIGSHDCCRD